MNCNKRALNQTETKINDIVVNTSNLASGDVLEYNGSEFIAVPYSGGSATNTLYTSDGSLTGNRTATLGSNSLAFSGNNSTSLNILPASGTINTTGSGNFNVNNTTGMNVNSGNLRAFGEVTVGSGQHLRLAESGTIDSEINNITPNSKLFLRTGGVAASKLAIEIEDQGFARVKIPNISQFNNSTPIKVLTVDNAGELSETDNADLATVLGVEPNTNIAEDDLSLTGNRFINMNNNALLFQNGTFAVTSAASFVASVNTNAVLAAVTGSVTINAQNVNGVQLLGGVPGTSGDHSINNTSNRLSHDVLIDFAAPTYRLSSLSGGGTQNLQVDNSGNIIVGGGGTDTSIYKNDGNLMSNRIVDGINVFSLSFQNMTQFTVNNPTFIVNSSIMADITHIGGAGSNGQMRIDNTESLLDHDTLVKLNSNEVLLQTNDAKVSYLAGNGNTLVSVNNAGTLQNAQNVESSYTMVFGGNITVAPPRFPLYNGDGSSLSFGAPNAGTRGVCFRPGFIYRMSYSALNANSQFYINKNGINQNLFTLTGNSGFIVLGVPITVNSGDLIEMQYDLGPNPGNIVITLFISD